MTEIQVKTAVREYFAGALFSDFLVRVDDDHPNLCTIHFGSTQNGIADVVLCNKDEAFVAIAECKSSGIGINDAGREQLKSYLNSKGTRFGILAASINSEKWVFAENLGGNKFRVVEKSYFEKHVLDPPTTEWTQQNVLKWKSKAEALKSDAQKWKSMAEETESIAQEWKSTAEKLKSDAQKWKSMAEETESIAQEWKSTAEKLKSDAQKWKSWTQRAAAIIVLSILLSIASHFIGTSPPASTNGFANRNDLYQVMRIIDGDTVEIEYEGARTSVQLIGVNAPETVHPGKPVERYGREATAFLQKLVLNRFVYFEFDGSKKDQYDRLLAYVRRDSDDLFVNVEIIRQGYGKTDDRYPFKYMKLFEYHGFQARTARIGIWSR